MFCTFARFGQAARKSFCSEDIRRAPPGPVPGKKKRKERSNKMPKVFEPVTEEERDRRVAEAVSNYEACGEWAFLIADTNGHVAELVKAATPVIPMAPIPQ